MGTVGVSPYGPSVIEPLPSRSPEPVVRKAGHARYSVKKRLLRILRRGKQGGTVGVLSHP